MRSGILEAPPNENGDDRDETVNALREQEELDKLRAMFDLPSPATTEEAEPVVEKTGGRSIYSFSVPHTIGSSAVEAAARASTVNYAAGTYDERAMRPRQPRHMAVLLGGTGLRRYQANPGSRGR